MKSWNKRPPRLRKGAWFYKVRGSYLPGSWQGWLTYIPFIGFLVTSLAVAMGPDHSSVKALYQVFPQWVAAAVVMTWIAARKS